MVVRNPRPGEAGPKGVEGGDVTFAGALNYGSAAIKEVKKIGIEEKARLIVFNEAAPHGWVVMPVLKASAGRVFFRSLMINQKETRIDPTNTTEEPVNTAFQFFAKAV